MVRYTKYVQIPRDPKISEKGDLIKKLCLVMTLTVVCFYGL